MSATSGHHIIIRRSYSANTDSYTYENVLDGVTLPYAREAAFTFHGNPGDLLILSDIACVTDLQNRADDIYVIDASGKSCRTPKLPSRIRSHKTWLSAWEGPYCRANDMMYVATDAGVDPKLVVSTVCACARTALHLVPTGEDRPRIAIETAESWTRGEANLAQAQSATSHANFYASGITNSDVYSAIRAASMASLLACNIGSNPAAAASVASAAVGFASYATTHELSILVREAIPVNIVMMALISSKS